MKNAITNQKITAGIVSLTVLLSPLIVSAQVGIPCDGPDCEFDDLIILANRIIKFLLFSVAVPLAALGFMWVGARMVLLPEKEAEKTAAKESALNIVKGFAIMLGAYVLIKTVLFAFLTTEQMGFMQFMFQ